MGVQSLKDIRQYYSSLPTFVTQISINDESRRVKANKGRPERSGRV
jgi:hypothetical protein